MSLAPGTRLGSYEILSALGSGGMGEVYRARDTRLRRDVAVKVLPESVARDTERLARFQREAQLLASLNHPNIAAIYGLEQGALVLELVEGRTLADLVAGGPLPLHEALAIGRQICAALDAAHDHGIVHRDLKPANIKVRPDGSVKVLDFGLAKVVEAGSAADDVSALSTITSPVVVSGVGVLLGTAAYMSPEQARGRSVDKRSDIWAFGCVLYEMLTGRRAFDGENVPDTLSRVLQREPDLAVLPPGTPPAVRRLVAACLEKDQTKRLPHIAVAAFQIDETLTGASSGVAEAHAPARPRSVRATRPLVAALVAGAVIGAAMLWFGMRREGPVSLPVTRLQMGLAPADEIGGVDGRPNRVAFAVSPDGRTLVFSATQEGRRALYVRLLDQPVATMLPGTEGAVHPFFSPDGQWVGYWAAGEIRKVPIAGGPPVPVLKAPQIFGASWGEDERIVFALAAGALQDVPTAGGSAAPLTTIDAGRDDLSHRLPHVLPGADGVLFTVTRQRLPQWDETEVWLHRRSTGASKLLIQGGADARYVSSGHLVYVRDGVLLAVPFNLDRFEVTGGAVGVIPEVMQAAYMGGGLGETGAAQVGVSNTGTLVYIAGGVSPPREADVLQVDRAGRSQQLPIASQDYRTLRLSPDGARLALSTIGRDRGSWLYDFTRGTLTRLTTAGRSSTPVWTPDGQRLVYASTTNGPDDLDWTRADGGGSAEPLLAGARHLVPASWTPDGRQLLHYAIPREDETAGPVIWALDVTNRGAPVMVAGMSPNTGGADVSPDGRWIAYHTGESGRLEVYVQAYPGPGPRYQVSTDGGGAPVWRADGRELFYARANEGRAQAGYTGAVGVMAVAVTPGSALTFGTPRELFAGTFQMNAPARSYDVSADGQRFLMIQARRPAPAVIAELSVVQNWAEELR
jgi:serine/threonine-protein kinase